VETLLAAGSSHGAIPQFLRETNVEPEVAGYKMFIMLASRQVSCQESRDDASGMPVTLPALLAHLLDRRRCVRRRRGSNHEECDRAAHDGRGYR
jgi:hypothetical protein